MAGDIVNLQQYDTSDIERLSRTLPRPQLPTDRKTVLAGSVTVPRHSDACTTTRFSLSITPVIHPPHTHFECECLSIESCCNDNLSQDQLVNEVTSKVQRLLDVEFPQVICDVREIQRTFYPSSGPGAPSGVNGHETSYLDRHSIPQPLEAQHKDILSDSCNPTPENTRSDVSKSKTVNQDPELDLDLKAVQHVAERLSEALTKSRPDFSPSSPRIFTGGLPYSHYRDLLLSEGEKVENQSKFRSYMWQLSAGAFHRLCRLSEDSTPADQDTSAPDRRRLFRRWEARFAIIDAIVDFFRASKSLEAFRVYEAVISLQLKFTNFHDLSEDKWLLVGQNVAKRIEWDGSLGDPPTDVFYDPVYIACRISGSRYEVIRRLLSPSASGESLCEPSVSTTTLEYMGLYCVEPEITPGKISALVHSGGPVRYPWSTLPDDTIQQLGLTFSLKRAADSAAASDKRQRLLAQPNSVNDSPRRGEQGQTKLSRPQNADTALNPSSGAGHETAGSFSVLDRLSPMGMQASSLGNFGDLTNVLNPFNTPADEIDGSSPVIHPLAVLDTTTYHLGAFADFPGHYDGGDVRAELEVIDSLRLLSQRQDTHAQFHLGTVADFSAGTGLEAPGIDVPCADPSADHPQPQLDDGSRVQNDHLHLGTIADFAGAENVNPDIRDQPQPRLHGSTSSDAPRRHGQLSGHENDLELSTSGVSLGICGGASEQNLSATNGHVSERREVQPCEYTLEHFERAFPSTQFQRSVVV